MRAHGRGVRMPRDLDWASARFPTSIRCRPCRPLGLDRAATASIFRLPREDHSLHPRSQSHTSASAGSFKPISTPSLVHTPPSIARGTLPIIMPGSSGSTLNVSELPDPPESIVYSKNDDPLVNLTNAYQSIRSLRKKVAGKSPDLVYSDAILASLNSAVMKLETLSKLKPKKLPEKWKENYDTVRQNFFLIDGAFAKFSIDRTKLDAQRQPTLATAGEIKNTLNAQERKVALFKNVVEVVERMVAETDMAIPAAE